MLRKNQRLARLAVPALLMGMTALAQQKPNFTGTWELTRIERYGMTLTASASTFKETQIWDHQEPKLNIRIQTWDPPLGYQTVELAYTTGGQAGTGSRTGPDGAKNPVKGSAHWEGDRLVYEQEMPNARKGEPRRMIRTCQLEDNGSKMLIDTVYWMAEEDRREEAKWRFEKKSGTP